MGVPRKRKRRQKRPPCEVLLFLLHQRLVRKEFVGLESGKLLRAPNKMTGLALLPSFSRRGGCEADGVVTWAALAPTTPPPFAGTPPRAGGEFILLGALRNFSDQSPTNS